MSFGTSKRGMLRHSRSTGLLTDMRHARQSRNCFQRRSLRTAHSTQCLLISSGQEEEEDVVVTSYSVAATANTTTSTADAGPTLVGGDDGSGSDSEYSEYDLVNERMQAALLDSDETSDEEVDVEDMLGVCAVFMGDLTTAASRDASRPHLWRRTTTPRRRRMAKKSESSSALSTGTRLTPSSSAPALCDSDVAVREAMSTAAMCGLLRRGNRSQRRAVAGGERRWLVPPLPSATAECGAAVVGGRLRGPLFTVVLDLDETLVAARHGPIHLRPHVGELLRSLHRLPVEIVVWTAGVAHYVNPILHAVGEACGRRRWFHHVISRHRRWYRDASTSVKDLRQLGRPLDRVVMVENNPLSALCQPAQCVLVEDYLHPCSADASLQVLSDLLCRLATRCAHESSAGAAVDRPGEVAEEDCAPRVSAPSGSTVRAGTAATSMADILGDDSALQHVEFAMADVLSEDGVTMLQRVEVTERVGGAGVLRCLGLRYSPPPRVPAVAAVSVQSLAAPLRSYGTLVPLPPL
ncbi:NLI interacting factor-like phosphatase [Novymonas esmeraldas]|uniref:Mitochondrial import inner membrane translocase subunit TIM50 n=1 Tax=Novymonas esmeraldas TaxID=1808958 RepID=A0AAW0EQF3_9TRYP